MGGAGYAAIVREIFDRVWNRGDFDGLDSRLVERVVFHYRRSTRTLEPDDLAALVTAWREAFPDLRFSIEDLVEDGDRVAARLTHSGTHRGRFRVWSRPEDGSRWTRCSSSASRAAVLPRCGRWRTSTRCGSSWARLTPADSCRPH
jgi:hypothetical protein